MRSGTYFRYKNITVHIYINIYIYTHTHTHTHTHTYDGFRCHVTLHRQGPSDDLIPIWVSTLMMDTVYFSEWLLYTDQSTRCHNPQKNVILAAVLTSNLRCYGRPCFRHDPASKSPGDIICNTTDIIIYIFLQLVLLVLYLLPCCSIIRYRSCWVSKIKIKKLNYHYHHKQQQVPTLKSCPMCIFI
jgi:hypothetical protein